MAGALEFETGSEGGYAPRDDAAGAALVIGGSGAVGAAVVQLLLDRGHRVVATSTTGTGPAAPDLTWARFDARSGDDLGGLAAAVGQHLDVMVFAAGAASSKARLDAAAPAELTDLFTINAGALQQIWRAVHPAARSGRARVVVLSSQAAATCTPGNGAYSASKAALEALALTLAKEEAGHGVRVNVVAPSLICSPMAEQILARKGITDPADYYARLPWGRALSIDEVAQTTVAVVCDPSWQYVSGQIIRLDADIPGDLP
ncbi:SDR family oxidoreductase [Nocardia cyriacigeorgica]|uniref:SDR family oxidoreductase n=1 Tax=Nocardia cyriacigeorgica TaxID=135487 RepID=UPI002456701D|nr:SDR family oxidoreductase [Nocardia cyriacigeorgica]